MERTLMIVNPTSGSGRGQSAIDAVPEALSAHFDVHIAVTGARGDAERAAKSAALAGFTHVIAAGGDGTINEVVNGLAETDVRMSIIPVGTANVLARDLGLPINNPDAAADLIIRGFTRRIDLGLANDRYFAAMAGFGFDAAVVHGVAPKIKKIVGVGAYVISIAGQLVKHQPAKFVLELDGERVDTEAFLVVVSNTPSYAYGIQIAPHASLESGKLEVIVFEKAAPAKIGLLHQALRVLLNTHMADPNVRRYPCESVSITSEPGVLMQLDGDTAGSTPARVSVVPGALTVTVAERQA